ncbi:MAG: metallophosphoesterase [Oxalobacteraceae bacterium]|nr:MAG: metallophosphoesterase [Oxalobacteraceae bacterium]
MPNKQVTVVGLISDTHGLLRPEAVAYLQGCSLIVHAGDVGNKAVLTALEDISPVLAVRGNIDTDAWGQSLPHAIRRRVGPTTCLITHHLADVPGLSAAQLVITGHSHKPAHGWQQGALWINPGSAGRRRFSLPISAGRLRLEHAGVDQTKAHLQLYELLQNRVLAEEAYDLTQPSK